MTATGQEFVSLSQLKLAADSGVFGDGGGPSIPDIGRDISSYTWEELSQISAAAIADHSLVDQIQYMIGGLKDVTISGYGTHKFQCIGILHDDLQNGQKAGFTFMCQDIVTTHRMNSSNTNVGGWGNSEMRTWMNSTLLPAFPEDLKAEIKLAVKKYGPTYNNQSRISTSTDSLWIASTNEVFGNGEFSGEGTQYAYWATHNTESDRIKYNGSSAAWWWLRSCYTYFPYEFKIVNSIGSPYYYNSDDTGGGVVPCFVI